MCPGFKIYANFYDSNPGCKTIFDWLFHELQLESFVVLFVFQEDAGPKPVILTSKVNRSQPPEDEKSSSQEFVVVSVAKVEDTGITEAEASELDNALLDAKAASETSKQNRAKPAVVLQKQKVAGKRGSVVKVELTGKSSVASSGKKKDK